MLINCDVKGLEVVVAAQLSGDRVLGQEIIEGQNIHENNRSAFNLPTRLIAKVFKFRLIYGGSAYSYAHDPDFMGVSREERFWQDVIDRYYAKYYGIAEWHKKIVGLAQKEGRLTIPSGRYYPFPPERDYRGNLKWPITKIKNYPVQGFGADLVMLARLEARKRLRERELEAKLVSTVHDSLKADAPKRETEEVAHLLNDCVEAVPKLCKQLWGYDFTLPLTSEVKIGMRAMDKFKTLPDGTKIVQCEEGMVDFQL